MISDRIRKKEEERNKIIINEQETKYGFVIHYDVINFVTKLFNDYNIEVELLDNVEKTNLFRIVERVQNYMGILFTDVKSQMEHLREELKEIYSDCSDLFTYLDMEQWLYNERQNYRGYYIHQIKEGPKVIYIQTLIHSVERELQYQIQEELGKGQVV